MAAMTAPPPFFARPILLPLQIVIAAVVLILSLFAPPARGAILLLPLPGAPSAGLAGDAIARGGLILERGPVDGSILVYGERAALAGPMAARGVLTIGGTMTSCGTANREARA